MKILINPLVRSVLILLVILIFDVLTPRSISLGAMYFIPIIFLIFESKKLIVTIGILLILVLLLEYFLFNYTTINWIEIINRIISIASISLSLIIVLYLKKLFDKKEILEKDNLNSIKKMNKELKEEKEKFQTILENSPLIISQILDDYTFIYSNYEENDKIKNSILDTIHEDYIPIFKTKITEALQTEKPVSLELIAFSETNKMDWYRTTIKSHGTSKD